MAAPTMDEMVKHTHELQDRLRQMQGSSGHVSESFASIFRSMVGANFATRGLELVWRKVKDHAGDITIALSHTPAVLQAEFVQRRRTIAMQHVAGDLTRVQAAAAIRALHAEMPMHLRRLHLSQVYADTSRITLGYFGLSLAVLTKLIRASGALNEALIKSNSGWSERNKLAEINYATATRTGQGFGEVLEVQKALVKGGYANNENYEQTVETVTLLHKGLGLSLETAAHLAVVVNNQVRGSFEKVSDVLANVVNQTSLLADEAGRTAKELGSLLTMVRGQSAGQMLPEMIKAVARYEDALKRMTGTSGGFVDLLKRASGSEGFGMAGMLGVKSPDMLTTQQGIDTLMKNFRRLGDTMVGQSQGWQRRMGLDALGKMMGISADHANELYLSLKSMNQGVIDEMDLRERYLQQTRDLGHSLAQLGTRLLSLMERGLSPVVWALNWMVSALNRLIDAFLRIGGVAEIISSLITVAIPITILSLVALTRAMYRVALGAAAARLGLDASSAGFGSVVKRFLTGAAGAGGVRGLTAGLLGGISAPVALIVVMLGAAVVLLKKLYDINKESTDLAKQASMRHGIGLKDIAERVAEQAAMRMRAGSVEEMDRLVNSAFNGLAASQRERGVFGDEAVGEMRELQQELNQLNKRAILTRHQFSDAAMTAQDKAELKKEVNALEAADRIGDKFAKATKARADQDREEYRRQHAEDNLKWYQSLGDAVVNYNIFTKDFWHNIAK